MNKAVEILLQKRLMILERGASVEDLQGIVPALYAAGIRVFEVTFSPMDPDMVKHGREQIAAAVKAAGPDMVVGAGTVLSIGQVHAAYEAGAQFIVSPHTDPEVLKESKRLGLAVMPGALTPTEIVTAYNAGADMVKVFPADGMGLGYRRNLRGPLPHIPLLATGGVNPDSIPLFFEAGINAVGTGITVVKPELVRDKNYEEICRLARIHVDAVANAVK